MAGNSELAVEIVEGLEQKDWGQIVRDHLERYVEIARNEDQGLTRTRRLSNAREKVKAEVKNLEMEKRFLLLCLEISDGDLRNRARQDLEHIQQETEELADLFERLYENSGEDWLGALARDLEKITELGTDDIDEKRLREEWEEMNSGRGQSIDWFTQHGPPEGFGLG